MKLTTYFLKQPTLFWSLIVTLLIASVFVFKLVFHREVNRY